MKKTLFFFLFLLPFIGCFAQTVQTGYVKEYNEKSKKTALAGVTLNVRSANSVVSDKNGKFSLQFLTLKPGQKVNVRRIEKSGYEIFNKEAVEQWILSATTPFTVVMCRSDRFKKIRDNYERVSSASYSRQLKKEEDALAKLKKEGKLKEAEYQRQLQQVREDYERQLDNLDNYVDRFARIDLSELSKNEQEIIALVQAGKIDEAIKRYEDEHYAEKYLKEVSDLNMISHAINELEALHAEKKENCDNLFASIQRQVETLVMAGGKENMKKAYDLLKETASVDNANIEGIIYYADFLLQQRLYSECITEIDKIDTSLLTDLQKTKLLIGKANAELELLHPELSLNNLVECMRILDVDPDTCSTSELEVLLGIVSSYLNIGDVDSAYKYINTALQKVERWDEFEEAKNYNFYMTRLYNYLGIIQTRRGDFEGAIFTFDKSINCGLKNEAKTILFGPLLNKARIYDERGDFEKVLETDKLLIEIFEEATTKNPQKYGAYLASGYSGYCKALVELGRFEEFNIFSGKTVKLLDGLQSDFQISLFEEYAMIYNLISTVAMMQHDGQKSVEYLEKVVALYDKQDLDNVEVMVFNKFLVQSNLIVAYFEIGEIEKGMQELLESEQNLDSFKTDDITLLPKIAEGYSNIGEVYRTVIGDFAKSRQLYAKSVSLIDEISKVQAAYRRFGGNYYYNIAASYLFEGNQEEAVRNIDIALEYAPNDLKLLDGKGEILFTIGKVDEAKILYEDIIKIYPDVNPNDIYFHRLIYPELY